MRRQLHIASLTAAVALATIVGATLGAGSAQAHHYDGLLAPRSECPHQGDRSDPVGVQERAMRCMHRYARRKVGAGGIQTNHKLQGSSGRKSGDILACQEFSHVACGRPFTYWISKVGFSLVGCYGAGENIGLGSSYKGKVRFTMSGWLHSDGHRHTLLAPGYDRLGIGMVRGNYKGYKVQVWTAHLAYHC